MRKKGLTLIELLITVLLVGLVVLSFVSIQRFAFHNTIANERRAKLQNEGYLIMERFTKDLSQAIGESWGSTGSRPYYPGVSAPGRVFKVMLENNTSLTPADYTDNIITVYSYQVSGESPDRYKLFYCHRNCGAPPGNYWNDGVQCCDYTGIPARGEELTSQMRNLTFTPLMDDNSVMINLTMRYLPNETESIDNPEVNLTTTVKVGSSSASQD